MLIDIARALHQELHAHSPAARAGLDGSLDRDWGFDSRSRAELLLRVERAFSVHLPGRLLGEAETLRDVLTALAKRQGRATAIRRNRPTDRPTNRRTRAHRRNDPDRGAGLACPAPRRPDPPRPTAGRGNRNPTDLRRACKPLARGRAWSASRRAAVRRPRRHYAADRPGILLCVLRCALRRRRCRRRSIRRRGHRNSPSTWRAKRASCATRTRRC